MPDYKEMYLTLFRATERAVNLLIAAQQECEERYLDSPQGDWILLPRQGSAGPTEEGGRES